MKGRQRRSHYHAIVAPLTKCVKCGEPIRPHCVCPECHTYRGRNFSKPTAPAPAAAVDAAVAKD